MQVKINNLTKRYQTKTALDKVSLSINSGEIYGLLGPNGAGKTSLIRILTQITQPDSGEVLLNNSVLGSTHIPLIGYLPEERGLYKKMTVGEQLLFLAQLKGMKLSDAKKALKIWCDKFNMHEMLPQKTEELSKGMQQKVQFVATVINEPKLLILDEPFSGFDPINAQLIIDEILQLQQLGTTIIFSTHRMDSVELLCDSICLINKGKKVLEGEINSLKQQFKNNTFNIQFKGSIEASEHFTIENNSENKATLKTNLTNNELLAHLIKQPLEILSFNENLPTIEQIFIQSVNQSQHA